MGTADLAAEVHRLLLARQQSLCCAESLTGGGLADLLSGTPGASASFLGGVVSYATRVKHEVLGVTATEVVSAECATQMALGVRGLLRGDWALATTGVAGPDRQEGKPVGTVYVGLAGPGGVHTLELALAGGRAEIRALTCAAALEGLLDELR